MSIQLADINPLRFIDNSNLNSGFDGNYAVNQLNPYQAVKCYLQPWQKSDQLILQAISDEEEMPDLQILDSSGEVVETAVWQDKGLTFPDFPDYRLYELSYSFSNLESGIYEAVCGDFGSEPFSVEDSQFNTILIKYKNSQNDFSSVFSTGIEFQFRVQGIIGNYRPFNDRDVFIDQKRNLTQLSSVAYRRFTFELGVKEMGVPLWVLDKYNIITQCDQVSYDGIYYQPIEDAEFEVTQNFDYGFIIGSVDIEPVDNNFIRYVTQPDGSGVQTFTPVQKTIVRYNVSGNFNIAGIFKYLSKIESIDILKSGADYILNVGITPGGSEIINNWNIDESKNDVEVNYLFDGTETIYFSGTELNANALVINWLQLDEPPVPVSPVASPNIGVNAGVFFFEINPGDLAAAFDLATGLGLTNGEWKDWAIAGTNGTPSMSGKLPIGWDLVDAIKIGNEVGSNTITIGKVNLPAEPLNMFASTVNTVGGDIVTVGDQVARAAVNGDELNYEMRKSTSPAVLGKTSNLGSGTPLDFTPLSLICVYVIKIA